MQKKLIALAVAGLMAAPAFAQSNVTIYGRVDYGFMSRSGDNGAIEARGGRIDGKTEFLSGVQGPSRLGFKGAEDLGNGLKAIFELEFGSIGNDQNVGLTGNRHAWIGLTGGFGTVVGGRLDGVRYGIFNRYDAFGGGNLGNFTQMTAQVDRANNAIAYISPAFAGFTVVAAYATNIGDGNPLGLGAQEGGAVTVNSTTGAITTTSRGNRGDARLNTLNLKYANGPISADLDWERVYMQDNDTDVRVTTLAGAYDFGVVRLSALYDILKVDDGNNTISDVRSWFLSARAPITSNVVLKATYGQTKDKEVNNGKAKKFGIGADYLLSKRTNLYASYGSIKNDNGSAIMLSPYGSSDGNANNAAAWGVRGFDIGIAHKF